MTRPSFALFEILRLLLCDKLLLLITHSNSKNETDNMISKESQDAHMLLSKKSGSQLLKAFIKQGYTSCPKTKVSGLWHLGTARAQPWVSTCCVHLYQSCPDWTGQDGCHFMSEHFSFLFNILYIIYKVMYMIFTTTLKRKELTWDLSADCHPRCPNDQLICVHVKQLETETIDCTVHI